MNLKSSIVSKAGALAWLRLNSEQATYLSILDTAPDTFENCCKCVIALGNQA